MSKYSFKTKKRFSMAIEHKNKKSFEKNEENKKNIYLIKNNGFVILTNFIACNISIISYQVSQLYKSFTYQSNANFWTIDDFKEIKMNLIFHSLIFFM
jgi:hypothetical protein